MLELINVRRTFISDSRVIRLSLLTQRVCQACYQKGQHDPHNDQDGWDGHENGYQLCKDGVNDLPNDQCGHEHGYNGNQEGHDGLSGCISSPSKLCTY